MLKFDPNEIREIVRELGLVRKKRIPSRKWTPPSKAVVLEKRDYNVVCYPSIEAASMATGVSAAEIKRQCYSNYGNLRFRLAT